MTSRLIHPDTIAEKCIAFAMINNVPFSPKMSGPSYNHQTIRPQLRQNHSLPAGAYHLNLAELRPGVSTDLVIGICIGRNRRKNSSRIKKAYASMPEFLNISRRRRGESPMTKRVCTIPANFRVQYSPVLCKLAAATTCPATRLLFPVPISWEDA